MKKLDVCAIVASSFAAGVFTFEFLTVLNEGVGIFNFLVKGF